MAEGGGGLKTLKELNKAGVDLKELRHVGISRQRTVKISGLTVTRWKHASLNF